MSNVNTAVENDKKSSPEVSSKEGRSSKKKKGCGLAIILLLAIPTVLVLCGLVFVAFVSFSSQNEEDAVISQGSDDVIAVVNVDGAISEGSDPLAFGNTSIASVHDIIADIDTALNDSSVKAIVLDIESPGGDVVSSDLLYNKVMDARIKKPVVAYSGTMATSGGYFVASAANHFVVHSSNMTGSIGVILQISSAEGLYDKLGIEVVTFKTGNLKDTAELFDNDPDGEAEHVFQGIIDESYDLFITSIVAGRGVDRDKLIELADGRIYSGRQAVENGLADSLGYKKDAIKVAEDLAGISGATVIEYTKSEDFLSMLLSKVSISEALGLAKVDVPPFGLYYLPTYMQ